MYAISIESLTKEYGDNEVLKGVDLKIEEGAFYALMGPNGSGKTTLASIIASVRSPTSGKIEIYGKKPDKAKEFIGYVPQENFSSPMLTGKENLLYFAGLLGYSKGQSEELANELLNKIGLSEDADKRVSEYSGGMRKRLEVATVLFPGTRILILDEPTTGLDPSARRKFLGSINELKGEKTTILLITHI
jgi:ABC-type multidrug transport system ATPase subunit